jgi:hypothetical protein
LATRRAILRASRQLQLYASRKIQGKFTLHFSAGEPM